MQTLRLETPIILFLDSSIESAAARTLFESQGIKFNKVYVSSSRNCYSPPEILTNEGSFQGIDEIQNYVSGVIRKTVEPFTDLVRA